MSTPAELKENDKSPPSPSVEEVALEAVAAAPQEKSWTVRGMLMMAACCAAPLLLLAAIPFLGAAFGSFAAAGSGLLSLIALLACPVGMFVMMRMMRTDKEKSRSRERA